MTRVATLSRQLLRTGWRGLGTDCYMLSGNGVEAGVGNIPRFGLFEIVLVVRKRESVRWRCMRSRARQSGAGHSIWMDKRTSRVGRGVQR